MAAAGPVPVLLSLDSTLRLGRYDVNETFRRSIGGRRQAARDTGHGGDRSPLGIASAGPGRLVKAHWPSARPHIAASVAG